MRTIRLAAPDPQPSLGRVTFRWSVEPATDLYRTENFSLSFPPSVDLRLIPEALWWVVGILCLHGHWNLLRPCRIELPVTLPPGHAEFWRRLLEVEQWTLSAYRGATTPNTAAPVTSALPPAEPLDIVERGPLLVTAAAAAQPTTVQDRCASAFSGGKDSLLQAALLAELTVEPILVATTSPMPPLHDHETDRRREVLAAIRLRRPVELIEVTSDFRSTWRNDFPPSVGYPVSVNEVTDTNLYAANTLISGFARGAGQLFLASETELQESVALPGGVIAQHPHCMYSMASQRALSALLAPWGVRYGSLVGALHSEQVQQLLWRRYSDLRDLQYSCWRVQPGEATCSRCSQCLRLALTALALGDEPQEMGIRLSSVLRSQADWAPRPPAHQALPSARVAVELHDQTLRSVALTPVSRVLASILRSEPASLLTADGWRAVGDYRRLRHRLAATTAGTPPGYRPGFARWIDGPLGRQVEAVFSQHFRAAPADSYQDLLTRSAAMTDYITAPLRAVLSTSTAA
jgi:hypothetical protein